MVVKKKKVVAKRKPAKRKAAKKNGLRIVQAIVEAEAMVETGPNKPSKPKPKPKPKK